MGSNQQAEVVLYYTSTTPYLQVKKAAQSIRFLLNSKRVKFEEHDVFYDEERKSELRQKAGNNKLPALFINGKLIGGADELQALEESEKLTGLLLEPLPASASSNAQLIAPYTLPPVAVPLPPVVAFSSDPPVVFSIRQFVKDSGVKQERIDEYVAIFERNDLDQDVLDMLDDGLLMKWGISIGADRLRLLKAAAAKAK